MFILRNILLLIPLVVFVGGGTIITFVVAPTVFSLLPSRTQSGNIVGSILSQLDIIMRWGLGLMVLSEIIKYLYLPWENPKRETIITILIILLLIVLSFSMYIVSPKIEDIRAQIPSFDDLSEEDPLRKQFGMWHGISMLCMSVSLLIGSAILIIHFVPKQS